MARRCVISLLALVVVLGVGLARPAQATTRGTAAQAMDAFVAAYWDPQAKYFTTYSDGKVGEHAVGPDGGRLSDFWWEARLWEVVMSAWERTGDQRYRTMIDDVYDGFVAQYPTFGSDYNDDVNWWALASMRAYDLTGNARYLTTARQQFDRIYADADTALGGGIWWRHSVHDQKNVATNAPAAMTAVRLYTATGQRKYLTAATRLFSWVDTHLTAPDGHVYDHLEADGTLLRWDFSYNFGGYIGAAAALHAVTGKAAYLTKAVRAADWVTTRLTNGGTFRNEGIGDGGGFKSLLVTSLQTLVDDEGQSQYQRQLMDNATQAWNHRRADGLMGPDWSAPAPDDPIESLTASAGLTAVLTAPVDGVGGVLAENGRYEAENGNVVGIGTENTQPGYTGRGYLAGWRGDGQQLTLHVNVGAGGWHTLRFRYAGDDGDATRMLLVNSRVIKPALVFPATGDWSRWSTVEVRVRLAKGHNTVQLRFDEAARNRGYLNLDRVDLG